MKRILPALFFALWTGALCAPDAARLLAERTTLVRFERFPKREENRNPAVRPSFHRRSKRFVPRKEYGRALEAWYADSFPWRTELLRFHRKFAFDRLKIPSGRDVPGRGRWIFRRGGDWPELDDFLGAFELSPDEIQAWLDVFEGRREWARAIGSAYLAVPSPVKARIRWQEMYPALRRHRGRSVVDQIREALETSPAKDDVLFADEDFERAFADGREVFFDYDHHPTAYGEWLLYDRINRRLAELFPGRVGATFPFYDDPPPAVLAGEEPGCWLERGGDGLRLDVSSPGETEDDDGVSHNGARFPYCNVSTVREGGGISIRMAHDSYMRFTLASWRRKDGSVRFPFAEGVGRVRAHIFQRYSAGNLLAYTEREIPDAIIEQFPECRLDATAPRRLDPQTRAAAAFARAAEPEPGRAPAPGDRIAVRAVFDDVRADGKAPCAVLRCGDRDVARESVPPGVRRAVYFAPVEWPADGTPSVALDGAAAASTNVAWRLAPR